MPVGTSRTYNESVSVEAEAYASCVDTYTPAGNQAYNETVAAEASGIASAVDTIYNPARDSACQAWWKLENVALTADRSGKGNTLNNSGVRVSADAWEGASSGEFVASSASSMTITDAALSADYPLKSAGTSRSFTITLAAKFASVPGDGEVQTLYAKYGVATGGRSFLIGAFHDGVKPVIYTSWGHTSGSQFQRVEHLTGIEIGRWYHICVTHDDSTRQVRIRVWDAEAGALLGSDREVLLDNPLYVNTQPVYLGRRPDGWYFNGLLDDVVVFNRVLDTAGGTAERDAVQAQTFAGNVGTDYTETVSVEADAAASAIDTQTSLESVFAEATAVASVTDTSACGETVTVAANAVASVCDTLVAAEMVLATATAEASQSDTAVFVEAVAAAAGAITDATDSTAPCEVVSAEAQAVSAAVDAARFSEPVSCEATIVSLVVDTAIFMDAVSAQAECSALESTAPSEVVSAEAVAATSAVDSLICVEAVAVSAGAATFAVDVAAYGEVVVAECFGVTAVVDLAVFTEVMLAQADATCRVTDSVPVELGVVHPFLLIQKTR